MYSTEEIYKIYIEQNYNKTATAKELGIDWGTVHRHVEKYIRERKKFVDDNPETLLIYKNSNDE